MYMMCVTHEALGFCSSWTLNFTMRQLSGDGHVITILSRAGVNISLSLVSGLTSFQIMNQLGDVKNLTDNTQLPMNTWIEIVSVLDELIFNLFYCMLGIRLYC